MEHTAEWKVKLFLFEHDNGSTAQVVLDTGVTTLHGEGHTGLYPDGRMAPEIDTEIAAGRALINFGGRLTQIGQADAADAAVAADVRVSADPAPTSRTRSR